jgi:hypothetical protein
MRTYGRTDRHEKVNSHFPKFRERALRTMKRNAVRVPSLRDLSRSGTYLKQNFVYRLQPRSVYSALAVGRVRKLAVTIRVF